MQRKSLAGAVCPIARSLDAIGDWWTLLIVRDAFRGMSRFGDFQQSLGVSRNILTRRLAGLVGHGVLERVAAADGSGYHAYRLTARGRGLFGVLVALSQWGQENVAAPAGRRMRMLDRAQRRPLRKLEVLAADGRALGPDDVVMSRAV
jgi:DNA-binding HxlR family transcriptional regulator